MPSFVAPLNLPATRGIQTLDRRGQMLANFFNNETDTGGCFVFQQSGWQEVTLDGHSVFGASMNRRFHLASDSRARSFAAAGRYDWGPTRRSWNMALSCRRAQRVT